MSACTAQLVGTHKPPQRRDECSDWLSGQRHPRQWPGHRCGCAADLQLQSRARLVACVQCCESLGLNVDLSWTLIFDQKARLFRLEAPIRLSICSLIRRFIHSFIHSSFIHSFIQRLTYLSHRRLMHPQASPVRWMPEIQGHAHTQGKCCSVHSTVPTSRVQTGVFGPAPD